MAQNGFSDRRPRPFRINVVITLAVTHRRIFILPLADFLSGRYRARSYQRARPIIGAALGQQRPGFARHLVGKRYRQDLERSSRQQCVSQGYFSGCWRAHASTPHGLRPQGCAVRSGRPVSRSAQASACRRSKSWRGTSPIQVAKSREFLASPLIATVQVDVATLRKSARYKLRLR